MTYEPLHRKVASVEEERGEAWQPVKTAYAVIDVWVVSLEPLTLMEDGPGIVLDMTEDNNLIGIFANETDAKRCADLFLDMKKPTVTHLQLHKRGDANDWTCLVCGFRNRGHTLTCAGCGSHA